MSLAGAVSSERNALTPAGQAIISTTFYPATFYQGFTNLPLLCPPAGSFLELEEEMRRD